MWPDTAVAVPATTAVVAATRSNPGPRRPGRIRISHSPFLVKILRVVRFAHCLLNDSARDSLIENDLAIGVENSVDKSLCPDVLEHHEACRRIGFQRSRESLYVIIGE